MTKDQLLALLQIAATAAEDFVANQEESDPPDCYQRIHAALRTAISLIEQDLGIEMMFYDDSDIDTKEISS